MLKKFKGLFKSRCLKKEKTDNDLEIFSSFKFQHGTKAYLIAVAFQKDIDESIKNDVFQLIVDGFESDVDIEHIFLSVLKAYEGLSIKCSDGIDPYLFTLNICKNNLYK